MDERSDKQGGSGESKAAAWAALGTVGAALVAGVVTLVTAYVPAGAPRPGGSVGADGSAPGPSASAASAGVVPSGSAAVTPSGSGTVEVPRSALLDRFAGRWQGTVTAAGQTFTMTLDIPDDCTLGGPCGTMTTDLLGCVGRLVLIRLRDGPEFDLGTVDFADGSSTACELRPGGGDYFTLGTDVLVYATGYDGSRSGRLRRVG